MDPSSFEDRPVPESLGPSTGTATATRPDDDAFPSSSSSGVGGGGGATGPTTSVIGSSSFQLSSAPPPPAPAPPPALREEFESHPDPFLPYEGAGGEESNAYRAMKSASNWNGLLSGARRGRGPQWDWATGMYHVDPTTPLYYSNVVRLPPGSSLPPHLSTSSQPNGGAAGGGRETSSGESTPVGAPGTPAAASGGGGVYDSGRPKRRAAMGR